MRLWFRVDNRLVHGQVIEAWLPYLDTSQLVVINDVIAKGALQQQIMRLAVPGRVKVRFASLAEAKHLYDDIVANDISALFLVANCTDAMALAGEGIFIPVLNVGNMHYAEGKLQICQHVAVSGEDMRCFDWLQQQGTKLDFRCVPGDVPVVEEWSCQ